MKIKLSKSQWEQAGMKAGWMNKKATADQNQIFTSLDQFTSYGKTPIVGRNQSGGISEDEAFNTLKTRFPDADPNLLWTSIRAYQKKTSNPQQVPSQQQAQQPSQQQATQAPVNDDASRF